MNELELSDARFVEGDFFVVKKYVCADSRIGRRVSSERIEKKIYTYRITVVKKAMVKLK